MYVYGSIEELFRSEYPELVEHLPAMSKEVRDNTIPDRNLLSLIAYRLAGGKVDGVVFNTFLAIYAARLTGSIYDPG